MVGVSYPAHPGASGPIAAELSEAGFEDAQEIGRGGFGIVYRCTQTTLQRVVALKLLTMDLEGNRARFIREQQAMGRLTAHPNVVAVLQTGETPSGYLYLVMPYYQRGSLHERIRRCGVLPEDEMLRMGVKLAGALESAHRLGIVHRDVKPANVLLTDYGEPALCDFGIAHTADGYKTADGIFTGSPAFTAPEVLAGEVPSHAADVYGLGATLFAGLTGRDAFERRSGEQVIAQLLRITQEDVPDLREHGISEDFAFIVETAMSRDASQRPSALVLGEQLQCAQADRGLTADDMALRGADGSARPARSARSAPEVPARPSVGNLRAPLTSLVNRRAELAELQKLLSQSRLVTLIGVGGVGKTTLGTRAAAKQCQSFPGGVWLVELSDLHDGSLLVHVAASALGLRDQSATAPIDRLIDFLGHREALLVLDNCEHIIDAAAELVESLLGHCPQLRILATSREALDVGGEAVLSLLPLQCPDGDSEPTLSELNGFDAVALFVERAQAVLSGFTLTADNKAAVALICARLDGLPLAIELAAARLRALSPQQIAEKLSEHYELLGRGRRRATARQQTLTLCVQWSFDLCSPDEQQLWGRLSIFAGGFELNAAHDICGQRITSEDFLDLVSALVDKSILIRSEHEGEVRFRLLEPLRDYGRISIADSGDYPSLRRRHADWYRALLADSRANWFGNQQVKWLNRLNVEMPNIREALRFSVSDSALTAMEMAAAVRPYLYARGMFNEAIRWLDLALSAAPPEPTPQRFQALCGTVWILPAIGDLETTRLRIAEARSLLDVVADPAAPAILDCSDGFVALHSGDFELARDYLRRAIARTTDYEVRVVSRVLMGWVHDFFGENQDALHSFEDALVLANSCGESVWRSAVLASVGIGRWRLGDTEFGSQALRQGLQLSVDVNDPPHAMEYVLGLGWIAGSTGDHRRAVMLMAAASAVSRLLGIPLHSFPYLGRFHEDCERRARQALDPAEFDAASREGDSLTYEAAVALGLSESGA